MSEFKTVNDLAGVMEQEQEEQQQVEVEQEEQKREFPAILDYLKAGTGEGSIEDYLDHPLNFNNSKSLGRMIRGFTGLIGELNYAVADILIGLFEMQQKKAKATE